MPKAQNPVFLMPCTDYMYSTRSLVQSKLYIRKYRPTSVATRQECPISAFADEFPSGFFSEWGVWTLVGGWTPLVSLVGYFL